VTDTDALTHAIDEIRSLVQPDGADFEVVTFDADEGALALRLVLTDASCRECVMPRSMLEDVATSIVRRSVPGVARVAVEDPRESES
jgi:Fe-S cluster biogenesis protein NfuA